MELFISYPKRIRKSHHCPFFCLHPRGKEKKVSPALVVPEELSRKLIIVKVHLLPGRSEGPHGIPGPCGRAAGVRGAERQRAGQAPSGSAATQPGTTAGIDE